MSKIEFHVEEDEKDPSLPWLTFLCLLSVMAFSALTYMKKYRERVENRERTRGFVKTMGTIVLTLGAYVVFQKWEKVARLKIVDYGLPRFDPDLQLAARDQRFHRMVRALVVQPYPAPPEPEHLKTGWHPRPAKVDRQPPILNLAILLVGAYLALRGVGTASGSLGARISDCFSTAGDAAAGCVPAAVSRVPPAAAANRGHKQIRVQQRRRGGRRQ